MSGKIEYLEKYSIAPSPSRDYYGLKVLRDQVILYLWKISHGPHKTPIVRTSSFGDFEHNKLLQDEIRRAFGKHLLRHVKNIASGQRNTLLTLPRNLINRLVRYLTVNDIVKLTSLSHVAKEIFNDNCVWEVLYKKYKPLTNTKYEKLYTTTYDWKQLFQQAQIEEIMNEQKIPRARVSTNPKFEDTSQNYNVTSITQASKKISKDTRKRTIQNPVSKKVSHVHLDRLAIYERRPIIESLQTVGMKSMKEMKDQTKVPTKNESKHEVENKQSFVSKVTEVKLNKGQNLQNRIRRTDAKISNTSIKTSKEKQPNSVKSKSLTLSKAPRNEKAGPSSVGDQSKPKTRSKTKISQSKSSILDTNTALFAEQSSVGDFGNLDKLKLYVGDGKVQGEYRRVVEPPRILKSGRVRASLDRLSEKSEPLTAKSVESVNRINVSGVDVTSKNMKVPKVKTKKSTELNKSKYKIGIPENKQDIFERYGIYDKYLSPRKNDNVEEKFSTYKTIDKMDYQHFLDFTSSYR